MPELEAFVALIDELDLIPEILAQDFLRFLIRSGPSEGSPDDLDAWRAALDPDNREALASLRTMLVGGEALPPALCDKTRTAQIIGNLLDNACKYTPHEGAISMSEKTMPSDWAQSGRAV